jgi:hypothetical protein
MNGTSSVYLLAGFILVVGYLPFQLPCYLLNVSEVGLNLKNSGTETEHYFYNNKEKRKIKEKEIIRILILTILFQLTARSKYTRKDILITH